MADGRTFNLTAKLGVRFDDEEWDTPDDPRPYGIAGWTDGDKSLLLYDRYDVWEISPDGAKSRQVTNGLGRRDKLAFRYVRLDPEKTAIPAAGPLVLQVTNEKTRATGAYRVDLSAPTADPVRDRHARQAARRHPEGQERRRLRPSPNSASTSSPTSG